jgi:predicted nucleic acid-binding protein
MGCFVARRGRSGEISRATEARVTALFEQDIADQHLRMLELADEHVPEALRLIASLPRHPLRTLDALHLAVARSEGLPALATADRIMAAAAAEAGFTVTAFFPETSS